MTYNDLFSFDQDKALEIIVYFAQHAPIPDIYHLSKICYFADLLHLERYGRPLCGDEYIRMDNGPVPSAMYNLFKAVRDFDHKLLIQAFTVNGHNINAKREADLDLLSASDIKCLDESIAEHGLKTFEQLKQESHDEAWQAAEENRAIDYHEMIKLLPNSSELIDYLNY